MWKYDVPQEYEKKIQEIISPFSVEFAVNQEDQLESTVKVLWQGLCNSSRRDPEVKMLVFGETENEVQNLNHPIASSVAHWAKAPDRALMISTAEGVVFCLSYVVVGDKEYVLWLAPENAKRIYEAQKKLMEEYTLDIPREMTMWESICNFFSELILGHPIDTAVRRDNYLKFYENAQKVIESTAALMQSGQKYKDGHEANAYNVARRYLDKKEQDNLIQREQSQNQKVNDHKDNQQNAEHPDNQQKMDDHNQNKQEEVKQQPLQNEDNKEQMRLENIRKQKDVIAEWEEKIRNYQVTYDKSKEIFKNQEENHNELIRSMEQEQETLAKLPRAIQDAKTLRDELDRKIAEQDKLATKKNELEAALREDGDRLPVLQEEQKASLHNRNVLKVDYDNAVENLKKAPKTTEEFLLDQYQKGKATREENFRKQQDDVNRQLEQQQKIIEQTEKDMKDLKPQVKLFGTPKDVKDRMEALKSDKKAAETKCNELITLSKQQKKQFDKVEEEQHKALVSKPSQQTREEAERQMKQLREPYDEIKLNYEAANKKYEAVTKVLEETQTRYHNNKSSYDKTFGKGSKGENFNPEELEQLREQRKQVSQQIQNLDNQRVELQEKTRGYTRMISEIKTRFQNTEKTAFLQVQRTMDNMKTGLMAAQLRLKALENPVEQQVQPVDKKGGIGKF